LQECPTDSERKTTLDAVLTAGLAASPRVFRVFVSSMFTDMQAECQKSECCGRGRGERDRGGLRRAVAGRLTDARTTQPDGRSTRG
jgi:hypothetical protein